MKKIFVVLVLAVGMLFPTAAQAVHTTPTPYIEWPIARATGDHGPNTDVVLVAPRGAWGIRNVARYIDKRVDGLRIHSQVGVRCSDYPHASTCITVKFIRDSNLDWSGETIPWVEPRQIIINTHWAMIKSWKQHTSGHELLHALGMTHHSSKGLCSDPTYWWVNQPVRNEIRALRREFR